ncbi:MAG TPA: hypothetical protein VHB79_17710 [Polyangiaceae bacterium]|nr:hypothetical protein [Polyangiaceae bacterium]
MRRALVTSAVLLGCSSPGAADVSAVPTAGTSSRAANDAPTASTAGTTSGGAASGGSGSAVLPSGSSAGAGTGRAPASTPCVTWDPIPSGKTLLVIGQDTGEIDSYSAAFGAPGGVMLYTNVADLAGFGDEVNFGTGAQSLPHWTQQQTPLVIQLGVSLKKAVHGDACASDYLADIGASALDGPISSMAIELGSLGRPVLLRFGYEFDNQDCHRYQPQAYAQAFRHFAQLFDALGARNVQLVWHAWGGAPLDISPWYPGDDFVDLVGVSLFPLAEMPGKVDGVAAFAAQHHKPLMIAEAAPQTAHPPSDPASWNAWYQRLFDYVAQHDVRVLSYINQDWNAQSVWASQGVWGNSRLQGTPLEAPWRQALSGERFLKSDSSLYASLACHD